MQMNEICRDRNNFLRWISITPFLLFLVYVSLAMFAVAVLLPCTFWLLVVRTTKVTRNILIFINLEDILFDVCFR